MGNITSQETGPEAVSCRGHTGTVRCGTVHFEIQSVRNSTVQISTEARYGTVRYGTVHFEI